MKVKDFVLLLDEQDRLVIRKVVDDIIFGQLTSVLLDGNVKSLDLSKYADRNIEYVDYTRWGRVCNMTLEDQYCEDGEV